MAQGSRPPHDTRAVVAADASCGGTAVSDQPQQPLAVTLLPEPRPDHDTSSTTPGPAQQHSATNQSEPTSIGEQPLATIQSEPASIKEQPSATSQSEPAFTGEQPSVTSHSEPPSIGDAAPGSAPSNTFGSTPQSEPASIGDAAPGSTPGSISGSTPSNHSDLEHNSGDSLWLICEDAAGVKPYYVKCSWTSSPEAGTLRL